MGAESKGKTLVAGIEVDIKVFGGSTVDNIMYRSQQSERICKEDKRR